MTPFQVEIEAWRDFFSISGAASATIIGLLFVAISLRTDIRKATNTSLMKTVVGHNFAMLLIVLLVSLYFMVPDLSPNSLGFSVLLTGAIPLVLFVKDLMRLRHDSGMDRDTLIWCFVIPIFCLAGTAAIGGMFMIDDASEIGWFTVIVAMFLVIPTKNSWELLLQSSEDA